MNFECFYSIQKIGTHKNKSYPHVSPYLSVCYVEPHYSRTVVPILYILCPELKQDYTLSSGNICRFHHLTSDCRYRVDGVSMIHITAEINQCNSPVDVTFTLKVNAC